MHYDFIATKCGNTLFGMSGRSRSANFPKPYLHNMNYAWHIVVPDNHVTRLYFPVFLVGFV